jgi:hypothetical protein
MRSNTHPQNLSHNDTLLYADWLNTESAAARMTESGREGEAGRKQKADSREQ